jgi:hypothetical protein
VGARRPHTLARAGPGDAARPTPRDRKIAAHGRPGSGSSWTCCCCCSPVAELREPGGERAPAGRSPPLRRRRPRPPGRLVSGMDHPSMVPWWLPVVVIVLGAAAYLSAVVRLRRRGDCWPPARTAWAAVGLGILAASLLPLPVSGPVFPQQVARHLMVAMAAPSRVDIRFSGVDRPTRAPTGQCSCGGPSWASSSSMRARAVSSWSWRLTIRAAASSVIPWSNSSRMRVASRSWRRE